MKYALYGASAAAATHCIYQALRTDGPVRKKWLELWRVADRAQRAAAASSEAVVKLAEDVRDYLNSSDGSVPQSLRQALKLVSSEEVQKGIEEMGGALTSGLVQGCAKTASKLGLTSALGIDPKSKVSTSGVRFST